jgi:hypothetical protein
MPPPASTESEGVPFAAPAERAISSSSPWTSAKTDIVRPAGTDASQNAVNHIAARALLGVLPVEQKLIDTMPDFLIGQKINRDAFQFLVKELLSPTRLHAPAIVLTGTRGHGQDQALEGLSHAVGHDGVVITIDAAQLNNPGEFAAALKEAPPGSVVRIVHVAGLDTSKPAIAADIAQYISQPKGDKTSHHYVLDVEVASTEDARTAAGAVFNPLVVSTAAFAPLSATAMETYCRLRVEHLLQQQGMGHVAVGFGDGVLPLLGELLATSHAPLHDIDTRLNQWLLSAFSTATDVTRDGGIVTVRLTDAAQDKNIVKDVTEQVHREVAQYDAATPLFSVHETGVFTHTPENTAEEIGYMTMAALLQLEMQHTDVQQLMKTSPVIATKVRTLLGACKAMADHAQQQTRHGLSTSVVDDQKLQAWSEAYGAVQGLNQPVLQAAFDRAEEKTEAVIDRAQGEHETDTQAPDPPRRAEAVVNGVKVEIEPNEPMSIEKIDYLKWRDRELVNDNRFFDANDENIIASIYYWQGIHQPDHWVNLSSDWTPHPDQVRFCARVFELGGHGSMIERAKSETRDWLQKIPWQFAKADFAVALVRLAIAVDYDPNSLVLLRHPKIHNNLTESSVPLSNGTISSDDWLKMLRQGKEDCWEFASDPMVELYDASDATPETWRNFDLAVSPGMVRFCARILEVKMANSVETQAAREWLTRVPPECWGADFERPLARFAVAAGMDASTIGFAGP